jgi:hypothetical protein
MHPGLPVGIKRGYLSEFPRASGFRARRRGQNVVSTDAGCKKPHPGSCSFEADAECISFRFFTDAEVLLYILQGGLVLLAGPDFDDLHHVVDKDLAVSDMAGVKNLLGRLNDFIDRNPADDDLDLDLRQQR